MIEPHTVVFSLYRRRYVVVEVRLYGAQLFGRRMTELLGSLKIGHHLR